MGIYACDKCPHQDAMYCHNCSNEDESPILHPEKRSETVRPNRYGPYENTKYLVVGYNNYGKQMFNLFAANCSTKEEVLVWFDKSFTDECRIVNIIEL